jgi:hypothetical protein
VPIESTVAVAAAVMSFTINSVPVEARMLSAPGVDGCVYSAARAKAWRSNGLRVMERRVGQWCSVGTVIGDRWIAEQWLFSSADGRSHGWQVSIALRGLPATTARRSSEWPLDIVDSSIHTRTRMRQSHQNLADHHSLSRQLAGDPAPRQPGKEMNTASGLLVSHLRSGAVLLSAIDPSGKSFSVWIDRRTGG